jgi:sortase A
MTRQDSKLQRWIELSLLATGLALILVYASARIHAVFMYHAGLRSFAALSETGPSATGTAGEQPPEASVDFRLWSSGRVRAYSDALSAKLGAPLAVLSISKLGLCVPVFNGTDAMTLNGGAGRISGTARPGERGNIGIAAHRDGFFRGLKDVALGDRIELAALNQKFVYTVDNIAVVTPSDVSVLQARSQPSLTLVTCYPFYFVGDAPQRYIVQASLVDSEQTTISELNQEIPKPNKEKTQ